MKRVTAAGVALVSLAMLGSSLPGNAAPNAGAAGTISALAAAAEGTGPIAAGYYVRRHARVYRYGVRRYPGYGYGYGYGDPYRYGYGYSPYADWTTRCMEDLGYGRQGMYGCGGR